MGLDKQTNTGSTDTTLGSPQTTANDEVVRRVWWQLIIQDYFEIAFANRYSNVDSFSNCDSY
jgi:hypothetical protein